jgi:hypothetical protein
VGVHLFQELDDPFFAVWRDHRRDQNKIGKAGQQRLASRVSGVSEIYVGGNAVSEKTAQVFTP